MKVFLAHPKGIDGELPMLRNQVISALIDARNEAQARNPNLKPSPLKVTTGLDDYTAAFTACGSWNAWTSRVAAGVDAITRKPLYDVIVVAPDSRIGAATKDIVLGALSIGKPVLLWTKDTKKLQKVRGVEQLDKRDFKTGWKVNT